MQSYIT